MTHPANTPGRMDSLLDEQVTTPAAPRPGAARARLDALTARAADAWARPMIRRALTGVMGVALGLGAVGAYLALRPVPTPDYDADALDSLFDYTLLTDEFNRLSIDERLALLAQLRARLEGMDGRESVLLAAFAARIKGELREQLMKNVSRLGIDLADRYAAEYDPRAPIQDREAFLRDSFVDLHRRMEELGGSTREKSDEQRLAEGVRQMQRDQEILESGAVSGKQVGEIFVFMNDVVGKHATPHERARTGVFMRDMTRVLRGKPLGP
ncbi:MAG: hypothetical protein ACIARR_09310 [Phycisphaerales bacterium JB059]